MVVEEKADPKSEEETNAFITSYTRHEKQASDNRMAESASLRIISRYRDIFQTDNMWHKKIYIVGDVGTGKSSLCKMMIYNWCRCFTDCENDPSHDENINEIKSFDFLFFIPLERMSGLCNDITEMITAFNKHLTSTELIMRIFEEESESCLIIADGLDEWIPSKEAPVPQHVSYGIPVSDGIKHATLINLCRPSAKGLLNMTSSESDQKINLLGINATSTEEFTRKYMSRLKQNEDCVNGFMEKIKLARL
ncbi:uncharacterized protein LOC128548460 [Mercenaria mercenaria]|uniref:uncharacterized protein LOC128548460 n=1 Tax=Mercenaria mercenaria TaxID=6596 RepID=UPI00234F7188|nr:uncharacterized protein LOC128548460 [Mercenaria mercenaria]